MAKSPRTESFDQAECILRWLTDPMKYLDNLFQAKYMPFWRGHDFDGIFRGIFVIVIILKIPVIFKCPSTGILGCTVWTTEQHFMKFVLRFPSIRGSNKVHVLERTFLTELVHIPHDLWWPTLEILASDEFSWIEFFWQWGLTRAQLTPGLGILLY